MHEFDSEMALAQAKELDEYYEKHGKPVGPLHGLPISLKDQLHVKVMANRLCLVISVQKYAGTS